MTKYHPLKELLGARLREFVREPAAVFWVYGFPLLLAIGLGIAFRNRPIEQVFVDVQDNSAAAGVMQNLKQRPEIVAEIHSAGECRDRLRLGKSSQWTRPKYAMREPVVRFASLTNTRMNPPLIHFSR